MRTFLYIAPFKKSLPSDRHGKDIQHRTESSDKADINKTKVEDSVIQDGFDKWHTITMNKQYHKTGSL